MKKLLRTLLAPVLSCAFLLLAIPTPVSAAVVPPWHPSKLTHLGNATQVVVVSSTGWSSTDAVLRRFVKIGPTWTQVGPGYPVKVGRTGMIQAADRWQGSGRTPAGTFTLTQTFGTDALKLKMPYQRTGPTTYWPYDPNDPGTYNVLQTTRSPWAWWRLGGWSERFIDYGPVYRYGAVINYNIPPTRHWDAARGEWRTNFPANTAKGGGIFLHVTSGRPTAGCVAGPSGVIRDTIAWLDPAKRPRIVIGPNGWLPYA